MTSPDPGPNERPAFDRSPHDRPNSFDDWLQALKEQAAFFTGLNLGVVEPRWRLAEALPVLPFVGAAIGLATGLVFAVASGITGMGWLAAILAVGAGVLITRALHEDGLADSADGLGPHGLDVERRLEIMRDSRSGTFGVLALAFSVLVKVAALASMGSATAMVVLIGAHAVSRAAVAYPMLAFSAIRDDGLGARVGKPGDNDVWLAIGLAVALAFLLLLSKGFFVALLAPLAACAAAWGASQWIGRRIGGYTGDTLGAVQQMAEIAFLVVAASLIAS
jgi:adenosylcobinamide-GDP ribazoletransferase